MIVMKTEQHLTDATRLDPAFGAVAQQTQLLGNAACDPVWTVERIALLLDLQLRARAAVKSAFDRCPDGLEGLALALIAHDKGLFTPSEALEKIRATLGIPTIPGGPALALEEAALYRALRRDTASASAVGG